MEALETRVVPYATTGNAWPNPQLVTISFVPDGTVLALGNGGQITSNMFATFNNIPGITSSSQWESIILKAAQSWAPQTNINFAQVSDDGSQSGSGAYQQGATNFGDIRIGGYSFGSGDNWLASTLYPPPVNNYSVAGDVAFNTDYGFNIGSTYDLFTVAEHEIGHALGLGLSSSTGAVMYATYNGAVAGLGSDDVAGIRAVYSNGNARSADAYDAGSGNGSFANASNITSAINTTSLTAVVSNLDITSVVNNRDVVTTADLDYYKFTAPSNSASTMTVSVQSSGLSLLSPLVTVYASNQTTVLGTANGRGQYGTTLTLSNIAVTPGATYYVKVQGADTTVFSTGAYALTLNLGTGANPTVPLPNTQVLNGNPLTSGGGQPMFADSNPGLPAGAPSGLTAAAEVIQGIGNRSTFAPMVMPTQTTSVAAPVLTAQPTAPSALPTPGPVGGAGYGLGNEPTEERGEQPAPPPNNDAGTPPANSVAPAATTDHPEATDSASRDACLPATAPAPATLPLSAPAVAEATNESWTPDGALAAASVLFALPWLRLHTSHQGDEERKHHLQTPVKPKAQ